MSDYPLPPIEDELNSRNGALEVGFDVILENLMSRLRLETNILYHSLNEIEKEAAAVLISANKASYCFDENSFLSIKRNSIGFVDRVIRFGIHT